MRKQISRVASWTMLSRIAGFVRDIIMAAVLGAGPIADAFLVAFRLPNHFRAIFAEGAVSTAYVPAYTRVRTQGGPEAARRFADSVFGWQLIVQVVFLGAALVATPWLITLLAPGFTDDPAKFQLAEELTRITFPSLLLISCMTLLAGNLNAVERFSAAAAAPVLMNLCMIAGLVSWQWFPTVGHAAAWGVLASGLAQFLLVWWAANRAGVGPGLARPQLDEDTRKFFRALGPAVIGSMGVQVAMFADTIIASFLSDGALSALYYADRINQLPIGVIGIAAGTVVLPQMAKKLAAGDEDGARAAQNRAMEFTLLLAAPCVVAFLLIPDLIMTALFQRGKFDAAAAQAAGATLAAYAVGLVAFVLIRSAVASFYARGDTKTPLYASLTGIAANVALKVALMGSFAQVGLALATSVGAWINVGLVIFLARKRGFFAIDSRFRRSAIVIALASLSLAVVLWAGREWFPELTRNLSVLRAEMTLALLGLVGGLTYAGFVWKGLYSRRKM
ncbi:MAG TPA: murein biosynthesis integral membrane protein MurJ [Pedomonas sp.]|uniref:murein biosynthesis integral membrane protein MurJ n=1 Tax=Pedomonas sp. TaxID=2976421 RepID=UPI002F42FE78